MDATTMYTKLQERLKEEREKYSAMLLSGEVTNIEDYRFITGVYTTLEDISKITTTVYRSLYAEEADDE